MKLEFQVVSLELAKKLKELGVKQEGLYYHWQDAFGSKEYRGIQQGAPFNVKGGWLYYSAFTVAELGEMLAEGMIGSNRMHDGDWRCGFEPISPKGESKVLWESADTEADARAKMLAYLIENKLMEVPR